jgi:hypothetical protein
MNNEKKLETLTIKPELTFYENSEMFRMMDIDVEVGLDSKIDSVSNYMNDNSGQGKTDEEKDMLYANAQSLYVEFKNELRESKFNFFFNRPQYNLLSDLLLKKLDYDINTLFIAMELSDMLKGIHGTQFKNDTELAQVKMTATELTYVYHLIQGYKVKGLTKEAYTFASLLTRIGEASKIINYYDAKAKTLVDDIQKWALKLDGSELLMAEVLPVNE